MIPLSLVNCINLGSPLSQSAMPAAAPTAEFDAELTAALKLGDEATEQTEPQTSDAAIDEKPIDSSISVAMGLVRVLPVANQPVPTRADNTAATPVESPTPEPLPATQSLAAPPVPDSPASFGLPAMLLIQLPQAPIFPAATPARHALPIGFAPPRIALPAEAKFALALPSSEALSPAMSFETVLAPAMSTPPLAAKLETAAPTLALQAGDWTTRLSQEILSARETFIPEISFRLTPRHLGTLDVGLIETPLGLIIELKPSSEEAKAIIAREEPRLIEELRQRGVPMADPSLQSGANGDGRHNRNGAIPRPFLPFPETDRKTVQDQDQHSGPRQGRFA